MNTTMKTLTLGLSAAVLAIGGSVGGAAFAQGPASPPPMERPGMDPDGDGTVTRAQAQTNAAARFTRMDVNKDGKLDQADRELGRQQMRDRKFAKLDANSDGSISKGEFTAERRPDGPGKDGMRDGRGKRGHWGRHHGPRGGMMMGEQADTNGDKAISQAEFTAAAAKRFDAQDANRDGQVTKEERQAARAAMKAEWHKQRADKMADKADKKAAN